MNTSASAASYGPPCQPTVREWDELNEDRTVTWGTDTPFFAVGARAAETDGLTVGARGVSGGRRCLRRGR